MLGDHLCMGYSLFIDQEETISVAFAAFKPELHISSVPQYDLTQTKCIIWEQVQQLTQNVVFFLKFYLLKYSSANFSVPFYGCFFFVEIFVGMIFVVSLFWSDNSRVILILQMLTSSKHSRTWSIMSLTIHQTRIKVVFFIYPLISFLISVLGITE